MARISTYPLDTGIVATDKLLGSDENDLSTKNFQVSDLTTYFSSQLLGYTSLVQLVTQAGTAAPVGLEVHNTTGGTFTWTRQSSGNYTITASTSLFTANKTLVFLNAGHGYQAALPIYWERVSDTVITLNAFSDGEIEEGSFEVKIYN